jgi:hypothetical protein
MTETAGLQTNASMDFADAGIIPLIDVMLNTANEPSWHGLVNQYGLFLLTNCLRRDV